MGQKISNAIKLKNSRSETKWDKEKRREEKRGGYLKMVEGSLIKY